MSSYSVVYLLCSVSFIIYSFLSYLDTTFQRICSRINEKVRVKLAKVGKCGSRCSELTSEGACQSQTGSTIKGTIMLQSFSDECK